MIERDRSSFPVYVIDNNLGIGYFEHPVDSSGDRKFELTPHDSDEAAALFDAAMADDEDEDEIRINASHAREEAARRTGGRI